MSSGGNGQPVRRGAETLAPADLQARLAHAYLSGNGAEVERVLAQVEKAHYTLPPKTDRAS